MGIIEYAIIEYYIIRKEGFSSKADIYAVTFTITLLFALYSILIGKALQHLDLVDVVTPFLYAALTFVTVAVVSFFAMFFSALNET